MKHWYQRPDEALSDYVRTVLIVDGLSTESSESPLVTNGMPALLLSMEKQDSSIKLFGKSIAAEYWKINSDKTIVAWFFKPFAISCIFNIPAAKLLNDAIDLITWSPHKVNALRTQLFHSKSLEEKVNVVEHFLIHQLLLNNNVCEMVREATDQMMYRPTDTLSDLLMKLKVNERTFQRIFKKYVGITPNHYRRICQFQLSFLQMRTSDFNTLSDVAFDNGFSDQSHFIRSFKEFAEITPQRYLRSGLKEKS